MGKVITAFVDVGVWCTMSLLGPDDFDLTNKERKRKLAKDLSPEVSKQVERWLEHSDEPGALEHLSDLVGSEEARRLLDKRRARLKRIDPLSEDF
jgi:hypothetical protein